MGFHSLPLQVLLMPSLLLPFAWAVRPEAKVEQIKGIQLTIGQRDLPSGLGEETPSLTILPRRVSESAVSKEANGLPQFVVSLFVETDRCKLVNSYPDDGCKIGCRCSFSHICLPSSLVGGNRSNSMSGFSDITNMGTCTMDVSRVCATVGLVVSLCLLLCRKRRPQKRRVRTDLRKKGLLDENGEEASAMRRYVLEKQLRKATPMSILQSQALLGQFFNFDDAVSKKKRRELRARLASRHEYQIPIIEIATEMQMLS